MPTSAEPTVVYDEQGAVGYITFNRPEKLNALNPRVFDNLASALTLEHAETAALYLTSDATESIRAFVEKPKPTFDGH